MTGQTARRTKTPAQRAQEAVDVLERRIARLGEKRAVAAAEVEALDEELEVNRERLAHAQQNPDLPTEGTSTTITEETR
jgi:hypothetical protein